MAFVTQVIEAQLLHEGDWIAAREVCRVCRLDADAVSELAALGVVAPRESAGEWQIAADALPRLRIVGRLMHDLGVNLSGAVLALELLEAQRALERRIRHLESLAGAD